MLVVSPFDKGLHVGQGIAGGYIDLSRMGLLCHHAVLLPKKTEISIQDHCQGKVSKIIFLHKINHVENPPL